MDWDLEDGWNRTGLTNAIYLWDHSAGENGAYRSWNGMTGSLGSGRIAPGQGFWVKADNSATPELSVNHEAQATDAELLRPDQVPQIILTLDSGEESNKAFIMLHPDADTDAGPYDAFKLASLNSNYLLLFTQKTDGHALDINTLPEGLDAPLILPLGIDGTNLQGTFVLSWDPQQLPDSWSFTLVDTETGEKSALTDAGSYSFELEPDPDLNQPGRTSTARPNDMPLRKLDPEQSLTDRFIIEVEPGVLSGETEPELPDRVALFQNYPNPFNPTTTIRFELPESGHVNLEVFDMLGRLVATLSDDPLPAGTHELRFDGSRLASGTYIYRLQAGGQTFIRKLMLVK